MRECVSLLSRVSEPFGLSYEEWSIKWWSWLLGIPKSENPSLDSTGRNAYVNQTDPDVFFLCQTFEKSGYIPVREVSIPRGKSIFLPMINWISVRPDDGQTDEDLIKKARKKMDGAKDFKVMMNGIEMNHQLEEYRIKSEPFELELPRNNVLDVNLGRKRLVSDGYWIFTDPIISALSITTFGSCTSGLTKIGVSYNIRIAE